MRRLFGLCLLVSVVSALVGAAVPNASAHEGHVLTIDDVAAAEGSGNDPTIFTIPVHVDPAPAVGEVIQVDFGTSAQAAQGATATSSEPGDLTPEFPEDFGQRDGTLTFVAAQTTQNISVSVLGDNMDEADETFFINLFNARASNGGSACVGCATIGDSKSVVTITDDDAAPSFMINDVTHEEGDAGTTAYDFTVTKTGGSEKDVTVVYATANDTATAPSDYTTSTGTLTFPASSPSSAETQTINVAVNGDIAFEPTETFKVNLSNATNSTIADGEGIGTITNDDPAPPPTMTVDDASAIEGNNVTFTITLSSPPGPGQTASVAYTTQPGSAAENADYVGTSGTAVFTAGESTYTVPVSTSQDQVFEGSETFSLKLSNPDGNNGYMFTLADDTGAGTITDDEAAPQLSINDVAVNEGDTGESPTGTFTVTKTGQTLGTVTVHYATEDDTATAPSDYTAVSDTTLSFGPEETQKQITVDVAGDSLDEANETFKVVLSNPSGATIADGEGIGTINDDDASTVGFSINDVTVTEGNSGTTNAVFTVNRTGASAQTATVKYATANGTAKSGSDYTATAGELSFAPADQSKQITVPVRGDTVDEPTETFSVNLSEPVNGSVADGSGTGTITDNEPTPSIRIGNDSVSESSTKACTLLVTLSGTSSRDIEFHYATSSGSASTKDYVAKSGDMTFVAGDDAVQIKIFARSDSKNEANETFSVKLSAISPADAATFADATGTCKIIDND